MTTMSDKQKEEVCFIIEQEGLDYGLRFYSDFREVNDAEFHKRRLAYIAAAKAFEQYIGYK